MKLFWSISHDAMIQVGKTSKTSQTSWGADSWSQDDVQKILLDLKDDQLLLHTYGATQDLTDIAAKVIGCIARNKLQFKIGSL